MTFPRAQTQDDRKWAEKAQELEFTALDRVKAAAEKWGTSITGLTGVFGTITLIKGPDDISALVWWAKGVVVVALGLAVYFACRSIYLAAIAAQGIPSGIPLTGP